MPAARRDSPCLHCGKLYTNKSVYEHERHNCRHNPNRRKRSFGKKRCAVCGKAYHAAGLRAHMATQHPLTFASEKARRKPSSRAARRREVVARAEVSRAQLEQRAAPQGGGGHRPSPRQLSPTKAKRAETAESPDLSNHKHSHKPTRSRADGSPSQRAWSAMEQRMSKAASK